MVDPTNRESLPLKHVRTILSRCPAFQTLVGVDAEADALPFIVYHVQELDAAPRQKPYAIVARDEEGSSAESEATSSFTYRGRVLVDFILDTDTADSVADQLATLDNTVGAIMAEFRSAAWTYGLNMSGIAEVGPPMLAREREEENAGIYAYRRYAVSYVD